MKKTKYFIIGLLALTLVMGLAGCGGSGNPKALAKETYDLSLQALSAVLNPSKAAELEKKAEKLEAKVEKLSASDKRIYEEELARLSGQGFGGLFDAASELSNDLDLDDAKKALDSALKLTEDIDLDDAKKALDAATKAADAASKLVDDVDLDKALDAAKGATDMLKGLGF